jgi:hypothetical protein
MALEHRSLANFRIAAKRDFFISMLLAERVNVLMRDGPALEHPDEDEVRAACREIARMEADILEEDLVCNP